MSVAALLLAAGQSRRFGTADKLLADLDGRALVTHAAGALEGVADRVAVVSSRAVADLLQPMGFRLVMQPPGQPQSASLSAGIAAIKRSGATRVVIALGDMPFIGTGDIAGLIALRDDAPGCCWKDGAPIPPAIFPASYFGRLMALTGDRGAGALLRDVPPTMRIEIPAARLRDIDRPTDLP